MAAYDDEDSTNININTFNSRKDDFETWVNLFERAVNLSTNDRDENNLHYLYKEWLPLKLDDAAQAHLENASSDDWLALKGELADLLTDPLEKIKWEAKSSPIQWDGNETIQSLASRVTRNVNKFKKQMPQVVKDRSYFERFVMAFDKPIRKFIHQNCAIDNRTIANAKDIVTRYLLAEENDGGKCPPMTLSAALFPKENVAIELELKKISAKIDDLAIKFEKENKKIRSQIRALDKRICVLERNAHRDERETDSDNSQDDSRDDDSSSHDSGDNRCSNGSSDDDQ